MDNRKELRLTKDDNIYVSDSECRSLHRKGSSLLLLDAWEVRMDNSTFPWASVSARRKIDCTSAIKSTIECKPSLHISHSSAHSSVVKAIVMDCLISPRISLLTIPTLCCIYRTIAVDGGGVLYVMQWVGEWWCVPVLVTRGVCRVAWQQGGWTSGPCVWFSCGHEQLCHCV